MLQAAATGDRLRKRQMTALSVSPQTAQIGELQPGLSQRLSTLRSIAGGFSLDCPSLLRLLTLIPRHLATVFAQCFLAEFSSLEHTTNSVC